MTIRPLQFAIVIAALGPTASCGLASQAQRPEVNQDSYVVEVIAEDYAYSAPDSISSGWITFRMRNEGEKHHFALLTRLPEGKTLDDYMVDVAQPFDLVMEAMRSGELTRAEAGQVLGRSIPRWFRWAQRIGGPALLAPGHASEVTLHLEPGDYFMECYMKTPEGEFHGMEGMVRPFTVTNTPFGAPRPEPDVAIRLTNDGIEGPSVMPPGRHTVAVHFSEQPATGGAHDVHLARLDSAAEIAEVVPWMDWLSVHGLRNLAPVDFFGGTHEMPAGTIVYVTVDLEPRPLRLDLTNDAPPGNPS